LSTLKQAIFVDLLPLLIADDFQVLDVSSSVSNLCNRELTFVTDERHLHLLGHVLSSVPVERAAQSIVAWRCVLTVVDYLLDNHSVMHIAQNDTVLFQELVIERTVVQEFLVVFSL